MNRSKRRRFDGGHFALQAPGFMFAGGVLPDNGWCTPCASRFAQVNRLAHPPTKGHNPNPGELTAMSQVNELLLPVWQQLQAQLKEKRAEVAKLEQAIAQLQAMDLGDTEPNLVGRVGRTPQSARLVGPVARLRAATNGTAEHPGSGTYSIAINSTLARMGKRGRNGLQEHVMDYFKGYRGKVMHVSTVATALFPGLRMPRKRVVYDAVSRAMTALARKGWLVPEQAGKKTGRYVLPR